MKFARRLHNTQTPEWKKAYIDYRGLKKQIAAIRRAQGNPDRAHELPVPSNDVEIYEYSSEKPIPEERIPKVVTLPLTLREAGVSFISFTSAQSESTVGDDRDGGDDGIDYDDDDDDSCRKSRSLDSLPRDTPPAGTGQALSPPMSPKSLSEPVIIADGLSPFHGTRPLSPLPSVLPLRELLPLVSRLEAGFFDSLDRELSKVENFYLTQEEKMKKRTQELKEQFIELFEHRVRHGATQPVSGFSWPPTLKKIQSRLQLEQDTQQRSVTQLKVGGTPSKSYSIGSMGTAVSKTCANVPRINTGMNMGTPQKEEQPPEAYVNAERKLKKAVMEHYRALDMLNDYRILNLTGFRKALKKFEKVSKIPAMTAYMQERVGPCTFVCGKTLADMTKEMENLFAEHFEGGDKRKAVARLRPPPKSDTHHCSMFTSGTLLGLGAMTLISGLWHALQQETHQRIPGWETLLFIYGIFLVPVLFSFMVGLNLLAWSRARINYEFIFELKVRTRLDHREYFEIPTLLLSSLCVAFWLSFSGVASFITTNATVWPPIWLLFVGLILFNPAPIFSRPSRWWILKYFGKLPLSGTHPVDFTEFWLSDQLCSMVFTISNLIFVGCSYAGNFANAREKCVSGSNYWPLFFFLSALPFLNRIVQTVKRYTESRKMPHLINAGKYAAGIVSFFYYYLWRYNGSNRTKILWCFFTTCSTLYSCSWDLWVDWNVLRPYAQHPFLRDELLYNNHVSVYYFSIVANIALRFSWLLYFSFRGPWEQLGTFTVGMLEMTRRWQWNFYRLESEQVGNMDQFQATREMALPFTVDSRSFYDAEDSS